MSVAIELSEPIQAHGETVTSLTLRKPTGKDIRLCGHPVVMKGGGNTVFHPESMPAMMSVLSGIPPSSVDMLSAYDWTEVAARVTLFFLPPAIQSSIPISTSPDGSETSNT